MIQNQIRKIKNILNDKRTFVVEERRYVFFSPGLFLVLLGVAVLFAPKFVIALVATFFVTLGILCCFLTWKFLQLKKRLTKFGQEFQGKVVLHGIQVVQPNEPQDSGDSSKKIIYH